jgi:hypothetical protein
MNEHWRGLRVAANDKKQRHAGELSLKGNLQIGNLERGRLVLVEKNFKLGSPANYGQFGQFV